MKFKSISARNKITGWNVENIQFNPKLTLLVGASGVGKTKILNVIKTLSDIATGKSFNGLEWNVEFEQSGHNYVWEGAFEISSDVYEIQLPDNKNSKYAIKNEEIKEITEDGETVILFRTPDKIIYNSKEIVKLDNTKSVVELLKEESLIKPIYYGFSRCYSLDMASNFIHIAYSASVNDIYPYTLARIKNNYYSLVEKLFLLRENKIKEFDVICNIFRDIFPSVEKIDFAIVPSYNDKFKSIVLKIKEKGVPTLIEQPEISSGMMRTLLQIITLVLANDGDVIMIDEFENGLGVNCINELAELIMEPETDIQVIMTSHHPYIINTIPVKDWKILTRNGCDVQVHTAEELRIGEHSKHEAFMQLLQTPEYKTGTNRN